jgi:prepilin-type N-terminal cleavage/methylation domain-containing protein
MTAFGKNYQMKIPPTPFEKGGARGISFFLPPLKKGGRGGFPQGFTLVEVIATILVTAILGVIFINFMGTAMSKSTQAIDVVQGEAAAEGVLERIVADYVLRMNQDYSTALGGPDGIKTRIDSKVYGDNVTAVYITFDAFGSEVLVTSGTSRTLKVTVAAAGNDLTTLLTESCDVNSPAIAF